MSTWRFLLSLCKIWLRLMRLIARRRAQWFWYTLFTYLLYIAAINTMTYAVIIQDDTAAAEYTDRRTATLHAVKHVEVTFLLLSLRRQTARRCWVPDDNVCIWTHRDTTLQHRSASQLSAKLGQMCLIELRVYVQLDTELVISETFCLATISWARKWKL